MNEIQSVGPKIVTILPALPQTLQWTQFAILFMPFFYLWYHGWCSKNLIDTSLADRIAKYLFILTSLTVISITFIYFSFEKRVEVGEYVCTKKDRL